MKGRGKSNLFSNSLIDSDLHSVILFSNKICWSVLLSELRGNCFCPVSQCPTQINKKLNSFMFSRTSLRMRLQHTLKKTALMSSLECF